MAHRILVAVLLFLALHSPPVAGQAQGEQPDPCDATKCEKEENKPVCGTDGTAYENKCLFDVAKCLDPTLELADVEGPCVARGIFDIFDDDNRNNSDDDDSEDLFWLLALLAIPLALFYFCCRRQGGGGCGGMMGGGCRSGCGIMPFYRGCGCGGCCGGCGGCNGGCGCNTCCCSCRQICC